ncbi:hypothetical protein [Xenorhabdus budapestensis]|uniref:DUF2971 domain-containing protein n=1 Tax=Xenorhabdus budapestensis TaxID=290110 RepID=A0A2D0IM20_XENBU|nr:hypothetical protein [Xenorhabdus budapestensis]PHM22852.1 hypothetical protein Xbud_03712 [Xenorhabdus budapestensis]
MQEMTYRLTADLRRLSFENHDRCVSCGHVFKEGDTSHLGYNQNDEPLYVCNSCCGSLKETAIRHYFSPRPYEIPDQKTKLWRYMDFTKYVSLLSSKSIYFTRTDCFEDLYEGAKGIKKNKERWESHYLEFFRRAIMNPPEGYVCELSKEEIEKDAQRLLKEMEIGGKTHKESTFVNCWHESEHESEAMWRLYSSFLPNAVAIRTSYKGLYESLGRDPSINIGRVKYIDFNQNYAGPNNAFWRKRKSFEHEKEVRALLTDMKCKGQGKLLPCNLDLLIEDVFVSPCAPEWFIHLLNDINEKFSIKIKLRRSELIEEPFF